MLEHGEHVDDVVKEISDLFLSKLGVKITWKQYHRRGGPGFKRKGKRDRPATTGGPNGS